MTDKQLPESDDPMEYVRWLRQRVGGHAPGYDIAVYARPHVWLKLAAVLERGDTAATIVRNQGEAV